MVTFLLCLLAFLCGALAAVTALSFIVLVHNAKTSKDR